MNWFILGAVAVGTVMNLKGIWQTLTLKKEGIRVSGKITGSTQYKSDITWKVKFTTLQGQVIEGKSGGWRLMNTDYFIEEETTVIYNANDPAEFMLDSEIGNASIYGRVVMVIVFGGVLLLDSFHQVKH